LIFCCRERSGVRCSAAAEAACPVQALEFHAQADATGLDMQGNLPDRRQRYLFVLWQPEYILPQGMSG
jgi:hypothetical protein